MWGGGGVDVGGVRVGVSVRVGDSVGVRVIVEVGVRDVNHHTNHIS